MGYNSKLRNEDNTEKLVAMMGSNLMIAMCQNSEIQNREINTARKLKIPILFIYNSEEDIERDSVNKGEDKIVFKNLEEIEMVLKDKFKLINTIKERKDLPFKNLQEQRDLVKFTKLNSILILKEEKKLLLVGDKIQSYDLDGKILEDIQLFQFNEGQLNACVNNKDKEIIILNNRVFSKYNFDFVKISEGKDKILEVEDIINEIVVNEENKHVYGISNNRMILYHFDQEFKIKQIIDISSAILIKVLNNNLYILLKGYLNSNIKRNNTSQIIENEKSFVGVYTQKENEFIKFMRKIVLEFIVKPIDFHVDEKYIFIFTTFINKNHLFNRKPHVLVFDHDGILLQKTGLDLHLEKNTRFLAVDYKTILCADFEFKTFLITKFSRDRLKDTDYILDKLIVHDFILKKDDLMCERIRKAFLNTFITGFTTILYYYDIYTDIQLSCKYFKDRDKWWFGYTIGIVGLSYLLNTIVVFFYSYLQQFKFNWKKKQYRRIIIKSFCLLFQLEMLFW
jgi:hypothetical protein